MAGAVSRWLGALEEAGVPCGPVNDMLQALADRQTIAREMVVEVEHSTLGSVKTIGLPIKFSQTVQENWRSAPLLGEDNDYVFQTILGMGDDELADLADEGVI